MRSAAVRLVTAGVAIQAVVLVGSILYGLFGRISAGSLIAMAVALLGTSLVLWGVRKITNPFGDYKHYSLMAPAGVLAMMLPCVLFSGVIWIALPMPLVALLLLADTVGGGRGEDG